jgi:hypothetical protein
MKMRAGIPLAGLAAAALLLPPGSHAQDRAGVVLTADTLRFGSGDGQQFEFVVAEPLVAEQVVTNAPFYAEAVNEFTQVLADGNRIERRYTTSLWRDSRGRTRREQQIALVGPLAVTGEPPRMVTITDPVAGTSYTLDENRRTAARVGVSLSVAQTTTISRGSAGGSNQAEDVFVLHANAVPITEQVVGGPLFTTAATGQNVRTESLGTQRIEGIAAEGTRTTMTIPAGAVGNVAPIEVVSERWFSKELQTAILVTRRDPRSGDTTYRLTNIVREEPPAHLFTVPGDYTIAAPPPPPPPPPPPRVR